MLSDKQVINFEYSILLACVKLYLYVNRGRHEEELRRWEEEEYYRRVEEERFWEEERHRRYEAEFFEWGAPGRMGPPRGPPGPMGPRPLMEGVGDMAPVRINVLLNASLLYDLFFCMNMYLHIERKLKCRS